MFCVYFACWLMLCCQIWCSVFCVILCRMEKPLKQYIDNCFNANSNIYVRSCLSSKDKAGVVPSFCYCQEIWWKYQNQQLIDFHFLYPVCGIQPQAQVCSYWRHESWKLLKVISWNSWALQFFANITRVNCWGLISAANEYTLVSIYGSR